MIVVIVRDGGKTREHVLERQPFRIGNETVIYGDEVMGVALYDAKRQQPRMLSPGERVTVGSATFEIAVRGPEPYAPSEPAERELLVAIAGGDDHARLVYADWLEQHGDAVRAEFLRVQQAILAARSDTPDFHERMTKLRELSERIDARWRVLLSRPLVEGCLGLQAPCPREWAAMAPTERSDVRFCGGCKKEVYYCTTIDLARNHAMRGHCIAVDAKLVRSPGDLDPPRPIMPGAPVAA